MHSIHDLNDFESCSIDPKILVKVISPGSSSAVSSDVRSESAKMDDDLSGDEGVDFEARMLAPRTPTVERAVTRRTGDPSSDVVNDELLSLSQRLNDVFVGDALFV